MSAPVLVRVGDGGGVLFVGDNLRSVVAIAVLVSLLSIRVDVVLLLSVTVCRGWLLSMSVDGASVRR